MDTTPITPVSSESTPIVPPISASIEKQKQASWGAVIIIVLIVGMIVIGAFYAWGQRVAETQTPATVTAQ